MSLATESTDAQWEAFDAAKGRAYKAQADTYRAWADAYRVNPGPGAYISVKHYEQQAADYDRMAAELTGETA